MSQPSGTEPRPTGGSAVPRGVWATLSVVFAVLFLVLLFTKMTALAIICLVVCILTAVVSSRGVLRDR